jgi:hypothetical protein
MRSPSRTRTMLLAAVAALGACGGAGDAAPATSTTATTVAGATTTEPERIAPAVRVEGPVPGTPQTSGADGLDEVGYVEEEFFMSGTAVSYAPEADLGDDGRWTLAEAGSAPFTTRILVKRPADAADASGVVVVEWNNVTVGSDGTPDWTFTRHELVRSGHAHVAVSAQAAGVDSAQGGILGGGGNPLTQADPERYGGLAHPGDPFSYDIFHQVGALVRAAPADGPDPLEGQARDHVVAIGESQSAFRLTSYVNGVHPLDPVFGGFLLHSRGGGAAPFDDEQGFAGAITGQVLVRDDLDEPVLVFTTETDLTVLGYARARQPDTDRFRGWEVAGTAHADAFLLGGDPATGEVFGCGLVNDGPQHLALKAALAGLIAWVVDGDAPPAGPRIGLGGDGTIERDEDGNAVGGIRLPAVEVPAAVLSGDAPEGGGPLCSLFGSTTPFTADDLARRYGTVEAYLEQVDAAIEAAVADGFLLEADAGTARDEAAQAWAG